MPSFDNPAESPNKPTPREWRDEGLHAAWLGHSSVLIRMDGCTLLTDPVLGRRIGVDLRLTTVGMKRLVEPALRAKEIPRPDVILLSHAHMDHFDLATLRALQNPHTTVVTASKTGDLLRRMRFGKVNELGWGEELRVGDLRIQAFEVRHWGARVGRDTFRGYNGYVLESPKYRVLFGGDTAMTDSFRQVKTSRAIDLALMPIGAYDPWIRHHCTPEQALRMAEDAGAECILPIHHKTFQLGREPRTEPIERLSDALGSAQDRLVLQDIGQECHL